MQRHLVDLQASRPGHAPRLAEACVGRDVRVERRHAGRRAERSGRIVVVKVAAGRGGRTVRLCRPAGRFRPRAAAHCSGRGRSRGDELKRPEISRK